MSTTLLHFLANTVELRHPQLVDFSTELRNVEEASKSNLCLNIVIQIHVQIYLLLYLHDHNIR